MPSIAKKDIAGPMPPVLFGQIAHLTENAMNDLLTQISDKVSARSQKIVSIAFRPSTLVTLDDNADQFEFLANTIVEDGDFSESSASHNRSAMLQTVVEISGKGKQQRVKSVTLGGE